MNKKKRLFDLYKMIPEFKCKDKCGDCCGYISFSRYELKIIKRYLKRNNLKIKVHPNKPLTRFFNSYIIGDPFCPFLTKDKKCLIYPVRPTICRLFGVIKELKCPHKEPEQYFSSDMALYILREVAKL